MVFLDGLQDWCRLKQYEGVGLGQKHTNQTTILGYCRLKSTLFWFLSLLLLTHPAHNDYDCVFVLTNMLRVGEHFVNWCY